MTIEYLSLKKVTQIYGPQLDKNCLLEDERLGHIPKSEKRRSGALMMPTWSLADLPIIGEKRGFLKKFQRSVAMSIFTTKGGVLKTTLTLNLARVAALHNIKTCVVGLDVQGDITRALGHLSDLESEGGEDLSEIIQRLNQTQGLADVFNNSADLYDTILETDLPTLYFIPETPELVALNESVNNINRREYWLKEKVVDRLKRDFDLILMDCSPNWNRLITNALVASDVLLSPLECKINNFRNFRVFKYFLGEFQSDMHLNFSTLFVPTKWSQSKKLSEDILRWYRENVPGCTEQGIRESVLGEEATALRKSLLEHAPGKTCAMEMRDLLVEIFGKTAAHLANPAHCGQEMMSLGIH